MTEEKKEEKLKELMNKISLVLKDDTLQQSFEVICKKLAELEKENADLKESIKNYVEGYEYLISTYKAKIEKMKCCENCKKHRNRECSEDKKFFARTKRTCNEWDLAE